MKNVYCIAIILICSCGGPDNQRIEADVLDRTPAPEQYLTAEVNGRSWKALPPITGMYDLGAKRRVMFDGKDTMDRSGNGFHLSLPLPVGMDTTAHVKGDRIRFNTDTCDYEGVDMLVTVAKVFRGDRTYVTGTFSGTMQDSHRRRSVAPITVTNGTYSTMGFLIDPARR